MIGPQITYARDTSGRLYWCNSHERKATHVRNQEWSDGGRDAMHVCEPGLGGILLPCMVVDLTDQAELSQ